MSEKPIVAVLMSTYNGEKYIREQLDSIFAQVGVEIRLFVRDDGSSDRTVAIIQEFAEKHPVHVLLDAKRLGPGESFMELLYRFSQEPEIAYFAFSDQDDIWMHDKMLAAVTSIEESGYSGSVLYSSNQTLYQNGKKCGQRHAEPQNTALIPHLTKNTIAGCTFVLNRELACTISDSIHADHSILKYRLHDAWIMLAAIVCGHVIYDEESHMLYRIHEENVVGIKAVSFRKRLGRLQRFVLKRDDANLRMRTAQQLLLSFPVKEEDRCILELYANYQKSWRNRWRLATNSKILSECQEKPGIFFVKTMLKFV